MRLALFDDYRLGVLIGESVHDVTAAVPGWDASWPFPSVLRLIENFPALRPDLEASLGKRAPRPLGQVTLRSPVPCPTKIVGAGVNYPGHLAAVGGRPPDWPEAGPEVFIKAPSAVIGPGETIRLPEIPAGGRVVHEPELAVVIGKTAQHVAAERAMTHVFGYTCAMDISLIARGERSRRKSHDTFAPLGPVLVTADEVPDPHDLDVKLWVNGQLRQEANTRDMIDRIPKLLVYASSVMTLYPGDVLLTGAPPGVGALRDHDVVTMEIQLIGRLSAHVRG